MKNKVLILATLVGILLMLSIFSPGQTGADPGIKVVTIPTAYNHLPIVVKNWPPTPTPTPTPKPTTTPSLCSVSCFANAGGFGFAITCESGPAQSTSECWQYYSSSRGIVTRCEGTRTYTDSGNTYSFVTEGWRVASGGVIEYRVSADVTGGVFGEDTQHCQNY